MTSYMRTLRLSLIVGALLLAGCVLNPSVAHGQDRSVAVVQAVAPVFPPLAVAAGQDGTVVADVQINQNGLVESVKVGDAPRILKKVVEVVARRWTFAPTEEKGDLRAVRLSFAFKLVPTETPNEELLPIFRPPYQVEVRARYPRITTYSDPPPRRKPDPPLSRSQTAPGGVSQT